MPIDRRHALRAAASAVALSGLAGHPGLEVGSF
jgi:hypothetical protein